MNFIEKKQAYEDLKSVKSLESDRNLLEQKVPGSPVLSKKIQDNNRLQQEILWALLDVCSQKEIEENRKTGSISEKEAKAIAEESGILAASIHNVESLEEKEAVITKIKELIKPLSTCLQTSILKLPQSITPKKVLKANAFEETSHDLPDDFKTIALEKAKQESMQQLLETDLETVTQSVLAKFMRDLGLEAENMKATTIRPILIQYKLNLPKIDKESNEARQGIEANPERKNELKADDKPEKEELKDKVEVLADENEELKSNLEDKELENEEMATELAKAKDKLKEIAEEKKN